MFLFVCLLVFHFLAIFVGGFGFGVLVLFLWFGFGLFVFLFWFWLVDWLVLFVFNPFC